MTVEEKLELMKCKCTYLVPTQGSVEVLSWWSIPCNVQCVVVNHTRSDILWSSWWC